ncbi:S-adenosyl-L-methionine-dependent tRNA 4-demethylwyosine synthase [Escovopsis weberi]|uniref:S-adenosyl-L-methionine-dependent tRNA 4-demethylwyosine synthase n=1 Tax=Escovopsis weberi TaxID=150374 RepID=A0A0M8MWR0_ESCWE|nr:S-adenosyl-L-methionine-dependent tRNA 4-demethylwyosine synthase [Escovopsis weberi]
MNEAPEISMEDILQTSKAVELRKGGDIVKTLAICEEQLAQMPLAKQPDHLNATLLPYQLQGLAWMQSKEHPKFSEDNPDAVIQLWKRDRQGRYRNLASDFLCLTAPKLFSGGILADDMGLGKTIQIISLILMGGPGTTLIAAPVGVMSNWEQQIRRHVKEECQLKVLIYHGANRSRREELFNYDVVITSYGTLNSDDVFKTCKIEATSRWVLTGTPIINSVKDLQSLLKFLHITGGIEQPEVFNIAITRQLASQELSGEALLQALMQDICLRRKKEMNFVDLKIPKKTEYIHRITFHPDEKIKYNALLSEARGMLKSFQDRSQHDQNGHFQSVLERLLRLRQTERIDNLMKLLEDQAVIPLTEKNCALLQEALRLFIETQDDCAICFDPPTGPQKCPMCRNPLTEDMLLEPGPEGAADNRILDPNTQSSKTEATIHIIQATLKRQGFKLVIFSQGTSFLDIVQKRLEAAGIKHCRIDGSMNASKRDLAVDALDNDPDTRVMLASLAVCSVGLNLVSADTVILSDSWWAPAIEDQASAPSHFAVDNLPRAPPAVLRLERQVCPIACLDKMGLLDRLWAGATASDAVAIWHAHRTSVIIGALVILGATRLFLHSTEEREPLKIIPKLYSDAKEAPAEAADKKPIAEPAAKPAPRSDGPRRVQGGLKKKRSPEDQEGNANGEVQAQGPTKVLVFFSSITTKTETIARQYIQTIEAFLTRSEKEKEKEGGPRFLKPELYDLAEIDFEDFFVSPPKSPEDARLFYLFLIPSYNIDTINDTLLQHLEETHHDFRIDTAPLSTLRGYSVFGFGDKEGWPNEDEGFCFQAKDLDKWMSKLTGRKRAYPIGMGDMKGDHAERFAEWTRGVEEVIVHVATTGSLGEGVTGSGEAEESDAEDVAEDGDGEVVLDDEASGSKGSGSTVLVDIEDIGKMVRTDATDKAPLAVDFTSYGSSTKPRKAPASAVKEMVAKNSPTYTALTKQGYSIVGSHSGVKICRWTKSALRGRGSCYKYSLYGINSHQCMETTPSLSCSNKCVFCWRHGTNPVGTTWRWVVDPPEMIFEGVKENHYKKIKMMRGVPGVRAERYNEALRIRHCALSLVGEPIFYPYINEFLAMLHGERISSFLVCNAQHPDQLAALKAVTQLYVSIDASNRDSLRKIDRPLHRDFWERFLRCLDILREKRFRHRTVYRLTLVKGFNVEDEVEGYARLIERGLPCFVEVKGVTYCGTSTSSNAGLSMSNVPFYWEVCEFVKALARRLQEMDLGYGIAAEHAHSCCVLLASERFRVDGKWHTHIDYQRFFELLEERGADGDWTPEDYMGPPTPEWALWGNGGFDPRDERVDRKGRKMEAVVVREAPE